MNRLKLKDLPDEELIQPGTAGCKGCGATLALRLATKALGKNTVMVNATGCITVSMMYGSPCFPFIHVAFENAAAVASGIDVALRRLGRRENINVICFAGDGGTADIGIQALSGAIERGHKFTYICYDNESYMNTGGQRSGTTPWGTQTTVTPYGKNWSRLQRPLYLKKDLPRIISAHGVPYVATASIAYPIDYIQKVKKALSFDGPTYIHVHTPCPPGWGFNENLTIKVARLAVQTGMFSLYELENGEMNLTLKVVNRRPINEYIKLQRRFNHLTEIETTKLQNWIDEYWKEVIKGV